MNEAGLGATVLQGKNAHFLLWAPRHDKVELRLLTPPERRVPMVPLENGYHAVKVENVPAGSLYLYRLGEDLERPDPASRHQPLGVHQASAVIDPAFPWTDAGWTGLPQADLVFYELHVGTFSAEGTFDAIIPHLAELKDLGITAVELMPVAQFPGSRNWGYDGVYPFATQNSYGGLDGLRRLVDACHGQGLAVAMDVVYNHPGPEGNYLRDFGPYFTDRYRTPWGEAVNFDGPGSDEVRRFFIENALFWVEDCHVDVLRLDAIHAIFDRSARPFLQELAAAVHRRSRALGRHAQVIAESDLNDSRFVRPESRGGLGLDGQWCDDFHHALHTLLLPERTGYYADFGRAGDLARAWRRGYVYSGQCSAYRGRRHGNSTRGLRAEQMVVFTQNHDQVGNRPLGERTAQLLPPGDLKLAAVAVALSPFLPLLFMGEEYGETAPFQYFISHGDPDLIETVRRGRREEFAAFVGQTEPPDPQAEETFLRCRLNHALKDLPAHQEILRHYRQLLRIRKDRPTLFHQTGESVQTHSWDDEKALYAGYSSADDGLFLLLGFNLSACTVRAPIPGGIWHRLASSEPTQPAVLRSPGEMSIELGSRSYLVYGRRPGA